MSRLIYVFDVGYDVFYDVVYDVVYDVMWLIWVDRDVKKGEGNKKEAI